MFCLLTALHHQRSMSSNFLVFYTSSGISSRPAAFLLLTVFGTALSLSAVMCPSLMSYWMLIISSVSLSVNSEKFPRLILDVSFHFWNLFDFSLDLEVLFLTLTLFTVFHANWDCLSSTVFLILLIWLCRYPSCSFWFVIVLSGFS